MQRVWDIYTRLLADQMDHINNDNNIRVQSSSDQRLEYYAPLTVEGEHTRDGHERGSPPPPHAIWGANANQYVPGRLRKPNRSELGPTAWRFRCFCSRNIVSTPAAPHFEAERLANFVSTRSLLLSICMAGIHTTTTTTATAKIMSGWRRTTPPRSARRGGIDRRRHANRPPRSQGRSVLICSSPRRTSDRNTPTTH